jgi:hypothetical protein
VLRPSAAAAALLPASFVSRMMRLPGSRSAYLGAGRRGKGGGQHFRRSLNPQAHRISRMMGLSGRRSAYLGAGWKGKGRGHSISGVQ